jgi:hypothetical protein
MWCPRCGDEFREGFTRCADCDTGLVAERPARRARRLPPWSGTQRVEYDLSAWPAGRRESLASWIYADNIPATWETETLLVVARPRANEIDDLIALLDAERAEPTPGPPTLPDSPRPGAGNEGENG